MSCIFALLLFLFCFPRLLQQMLALSLFFLDYLEVAKSEQSCTSCLFKFRNWPIVLTFSFAFCQSFYKINRRIGALVFPEFVNILFLWIQTCCTCISSQSYSLTSCRERLDRKADAVALLFSLLVLNQCIGIYLLQLISLGGS